MPACMGTFVHHTDTHTHMIVMLTSSIVACGKCANTVIMYMYSAYLDCFHYSIYIPIGFHFFFSSQRIVCSELADEGTNVVLFTFGPFCYII